MDEPIVATTAGRVRGVRRARVRAFLGVPYAAPPVDRLRFEPPALHATWQGVRDATLPGPTAPQIVQPFPELDVTPLIGSGWRRGDDFLTVNVWTPDFKDAPGELAPVMVYIHGGAWVLGSNDTQIQDGSGFARSGVVCFSMNYRLGVEGFLPIPGAPTNLGLRDQIAALRWVRENAAAFGGDAANITVFGESAGAMSVADLVTSPLAKGLFRRVIIESGHGAMVRPIQVGRKLGKALARKLKVSCDVQGFRSCTPERCLEALAEIQAPTARIDMRDARGFDPAFGLSRFLPVYGDDVLPEPPLEALASGTGVDVEVLIGTNREEMNLYWVPSGAKTSISSILANSYLRKCMPGARKVLKAYGLGQRGRTAGEVFAQATTDLVFRWPARRFAETHRGRAHLYEFEWRSPAFEGRLGACHGLELPFAFDTLATCTGPRGLAGPSPPQALADRMHRLWVDFAKGAAPPWPPYDPDTRQVFALEAGVSAFEPAAPAAPFLP